MHDADLNPSALLRATQPVIVAVLPAFEHAHGIAVICRGRRPLVRPHEQQPAAHSSIVRAVHLEIDFDLEIDIDFGRKASGRRRLDSSRGLPPRRQQFVETADRIVVDALHDIGDLRKAIDAARLACRGTEYSPARCLPAST
ncbi:MAG TPA: hypothetical protein VJR89_25910 [Polyangiales bacterium]|nr:hypothetical protein [Polyangiales bacterium]